MIHKIFTVFDQAAEAYLTPFFLHSEGMAKRSFKDAIGDQSHQFGMNPEDYTLFHIGEYDDETAQIEHMYPRSLGNGLEYLTQKTQEVTNEE